jgi:nicotinamide-nucleotide amidase
MRRAEILSVGDELLIGRTVNNNAAFMGRLLAETGIETHWLTSVGDDMERLVSAIETAWERVDIVLMTGGLGPTHDDITKDALCRFFGVDMTFHSEIIAEMKTRYKTRDMDMPDIVNNQGLIPVGAELIRNELGSAFGLLFKRDVKILIALPGVPFEMEPMMVDSVIPFLKRFSGEHTILMQTIRTTGIIESKLVTEFCRLDEVRQLAGVAVLPKVTGVELRLTVRNDSREEACRIMERAVAITREDIGQWIVAVGDALIEDVLCDALSRAGMTVATAESCTGGLVADMLTNVPGSSKYFSGGVICYSNRLKQELLGVPAELLDEYGAVSAGVAETMAAGVRNQIKSDYGVATTGIAGPGGATDKKPVGMAFVAVAGPNGVVSEKVVFNVNRKLNKTRFAQAALNLLFKQLPDTYRILAQKTVGHER